MPYLQTPGEMADELADLFGVYGGHHEACGYYNRETTATPTALLDFLKARPCRICWNSVVEARIRSTVKNEERLGAKP